VRQLVPSILAFVLQWDHATKLGHCQIILFIQFSYF
jgi:hypothetical protein